MTWEFFLVIKSSWHFILRFIKCKIFVIDAVTESVNMQQDNHYDVNISYLIPMSRFYKQSVVLQSITYKV